MGEQDPIFESNKAGIEAGSSGYPENVLRSIGYIAAHISEANRQNKLGNFGRSSFRRDEHRDLARNYLAQAHGASDILSFFCEPPGDKSWFQEISLQQAQQKYSS